jgi:site-specific DNA recombinase
LTIAASEALRAGIYCRISRDRDGEGLGVERQRQDAERLVASRGWTTAGTYADNDLSAYSGKRRPGYEQLLEDVRNGSVNAIVAWHPDRLHRSPKELESFIDLIESRGTLVETVTAGPVDLATPTGRAVARTLGAWARYESEHKAERQRRKHLELAERGIPTGGGTRPFGHSSDWRALIPEEAALVREGVERVLAGDSLRSIASDWNRRNIRTSTGGRWQQQPLRRMLTSGRIAGLRELRGTETRTAQWGKNAGEPITVRTAVPKLVTQGQWPRIIDVETLMRVRAVLLDPTRRKTGTRGEKYLLTGLLRCHACGGRLVARPREDKTRRYVCSTGPMYEGCGKTFVLAEPLEKLVSDMVMLAIDGPDLQRALAARNGHDKADIAALTTALSAAKERIRWLGEDFAEGKVSREAFAQADRAIGDKVRELNEVLAAATAAAPVARLVGGAVERWPELSFDQRRAVLSAVVEKVVIGAGRRGYNRFDPTRVDVRWAA